MPTHARKMPEAQAESLTALLNETSGVNIETQHSSEDIIYVVYVHPSKFGDWMRFVKDKGPSYHGGNQGPNKLTQKLDHIPLRSTGLFRALPDGTIQSFPQAAKNGAPQALEVATGLRTSYDHVLKDAWPLELEVFYHMGGCVWFQGPHECYDFERTNYEYQDTSYFSLLAKALPALADAFEDVLKRHPDFVASLTKKENEHRQVQRK